MLVFIIYKFNNLNIIIYLIILTLLCTSVDPVPLIYKIYTPIQLYTSKNFLQIFLKKFYQVAPTKHESELNNKNGQKCCVTTSEQALLFALI